MFTNLDNMKNWVTDVMSKDSEFIERVLYTIEQTVGTVWSDSNYQIYLMQDNCKVQNIMNILETIQNEINNQITLEEETFVEPFVIDNDFDNDDIDFIELEDDEEDTCKLEQLKSSELYQYIYDLVRAYYSTERLQKNYETSSYVFTDSQGNQKSLKDCHVILKGIIACTRMV